MSTKLDRGIAELDAQLLPDGDYAYYDDAMSRWYVIDEDDLAEIPAYQDEAVGLCQYHCAASQSHRWYDMDGELA